VVTRVFDAPRDAVWKAWTEPAQLKEWWGPTKHSVPECHIDLRVGGRYLLCERAAGGSMLWVTGTYREVVAPERLVTTLSFADSQGNIVPPGHYRLHPGMPLEMLVTVTFEARGRKTAVTVRQEGLLDDQIGRFIGEGWGEAFDKLDALLHALGR
jgi:uncharacterized protein YndB with AHSA1/START domain